MIIDMKFTPNNLQKHLLKEILKFDKTIKESSIFLLGIK